MRSFSPRDMECRTTLTLNCGGLNDKAAAVDVGEGDILGGDDVKVARRDAMSCFDGLDILTGDLSGAPSIHAEDG